jgi:hypothetical protein
MGVIHRTAIRLPQMRFALAQPIMQQRDNWFMERYAGLSRNFVSKTNALGMENVSKLEALSKMSQSFLDDQVHLTLDSGKTYINELLFYSDTFFTAEIVNLEGGTSNNPERIGKEKEKNQLESDFEKSVKTLDNKLEELNRDIFQRHSHDSLVMARIREDLDVISNMAKEDKLMTSGMIRKVPKPMGKDEIRKWLKDIVSDILNSIEPGVSSEITFVSQGHSNSRDIPLAEVRISSREIALRLRKTFAQKRNLVKTLGEPIYHTA